MKATLWQKKNFKIVDSVFCRISKGHLVLELPDGTNRDYGDASEPVCIKAIDWKFFNRLVTGGSVGLGDAWISSLWECDNLTGLIELFIDNLADFKSNIDPTPVKCLVGKIVLFVRRNSRLGSCKNIHAHYDLGNDFYSLFLDHRTMMYSCALFNDNIESLADAQQRKIERIIEIADLKEHHHVLEIGCGWGGFALMAARLTGCRVTGLTISREQYDFARQRVREEKLGDKIDIQMCDYRDVKGVYDRIVSIEMLEAVGYEYFGTFFENCDRLLEEGGRVVLQSITIPDQRFDNYRRKLDWIQKHIFPGGLLPSLTELCKAMTSSSGLTVQHLDNIGINYVETLKRWRISFENNLEAVSALGFDEKFQRMWIYYLCSCEASFKKRYLYDIQLVLSRAGELSV